MRENLAAVLLSFIASVSCCPAQSCEPYYETSINARRGYTPYYMLTVPDIPGDRLPGGIYASTINSTDRAILYWNGQRWVTAFSYGTGLVVGMLMHDEDGAGPAPRAIYVGTMSRILRWDGETLADVSRGLTISNMLGIGVWDEDGPGDREPALFVFGRSFTLNGTTFAGAAKWDGLEWTPMPFPTQWSIFSIIPAELVGFDPDGPGPEEGRLYVGANFWAPGGGLIARWMGSNWELVGGGYYYSSFAAIYEMKIFDLDGDGPALPKLFVASDSAPANGSGGATINTWDGVSWTGFPEYHGSFVHAIEPFDLDGPGPIREKLYMADEGWRLHTFDGETFVDHGRAFSLWPAVAMHQTTLNGSRALIFSGSFDGAFGAPVTGFAAILGCPRTCPMDLDENGSVDLEDLSILLANFGTSGGMSHETGDLDDDDDVDLHDLGYLLADFGMVC